MKKYTDDKGSRCSGYGVYPDGRKCNGCGDCEGRFLKRGATYKQLKKIFNQNHTLLKLQNAKNKKGS